MSNTVTKRRTDFFDLDSEIAVLDFQPNGGNDDGDDGGNDDGDDGGNDDGDDGDDGAEEEAAEEEEAADDEPVDFGPDGPVD